MVNTINSNSSPDGISQPYRIMGLDPGYDRLGFGFLDWHPTQPNHYIVGQWGVISTPKTETDAVRLAEIFQDLGQLIAQYAPTHMVLERLFFFKNAKTVIPVAQARGIILLCAAQRGITVAEYTPQQVKQSLAGSGRADKRMVQDGVQSFLGLETLPKPDDAADALALAVTHTLFSRGQTVLV